MPFHVPSPVVYPAVDTYADLPVASVHTDDVYLVRLKTGTIFINRKRAGLYISDGIEWKRLGGIIVAASESPTPGYLPSNPPVGKCVVSNLYVDPSTGKLSVEYEDTPIE